MKLSHLLIATLVTSALVAVSQPDTKQKKQKAKTKSEKKAKQKLSTTKLTAVDTTLYHEKHFVCEACGRG